jgi:hypothetical protein
VRPKLIGEEPDYIAPIDITKLRVHRSRRFCALPKPKRDWTFESHVQHEQRRLRQLWLQGLGWDRRVLCYTVGSILRRVWLNRLHTALPGDPVVHRLLLRARVRDPYDIIRGRWGIRLLTGQEMRRVTREAIRMRAELAASREA